MRGMRRRGIPCPPGLLLVRVSGKRLCAKPRPAHVLHSRLVLAAHMQGDNLVHALNAESSSRQSVSDQSIGRQYRKPYAHTGK